MNVPLREFYDFYNHAVTIYDIHSPYFYSLIRFIKDKERKYYAFEEIERQRDKLLKNKSSIHRNDRGAGSRIMSNTNTKIKQIARTSLSSPKQCRELFRMALYAEAENILELGSSLGISTAYLAKSRASSTVTSVDADENILEYAQHNIANLNIDNVNFVHSTFTDFLNSRTENEEYDLIFHDGNHTYSDTLKYIEIIEQFMPEESILIIDDILWSGGMYKAWKEIRHWKAFDGSLAFYNYGILVKSRKLDEQININYISKWLKPWRMGFTA